ncbi:MAG: PilZ domain-containing protein [Gammaproteobacteria bacterium]|nr:PilZ domain-containing protein [Gammaproteobacteria bacterium]MDH3412504.1 PilZ domain-containing protein [Gammaproteobacteria bacterium]
MTAKLPEKGRDYRAHTALPASLENATGITRDMSASGAFFWISGTHAIGEPVSFSIELKTPGGRMVWTCRGEVVRTEPRGTDIGAAVRITRTAVEPM